LSFLFRIICSKIHYRHYITKFLIYWPTGNFIPVYSYSELVFESLLRHHLSSLSVILSFLQEHSPENTSITSRQLPSESFPVHIPNEPAKHCTERHSLPDLQHTLLTKEIRLQNLGSNAHSTPFVLPLLITEPWGFRGQPLTKRFPFPAIQTSPPMLYKFTATLQIAGSHNLFSTNLTGKWRTNSCRGGGCMT
jgi:hypothetical protein